MNKHLISGKMVKDGCPSFTFKRLCVHHEERYSERVKEARVAYLKSYLHYKERGTVFIFIDETHFRATDFRYYGRAPTGERAISRKRLTRISVTAITAITSVGTIPHTMFIRGSVNQSVFQVFIHELVKCIDRNSFQYTIVMDNVGFHRTQDVRDLIKGYGISLLLTAPWSCELNPIEYIFSIWKSRVRIPSDEVNIDGILGFLSESLKSIAGFEIIKCVLYVETKLFPLVAAHEPLHLRREVRRFQESNTEVAFGNAQDITDEGDDDELLAEEEDEVSEEEEEEEEDQ